jgi:hypothetical protein
VANLERALSKGSRDFIYLSNVKTLPIPSIFLRGFPSHSFAPLGKHCSSSGQIPNRGPISSAKKRVVRSGDKPSRGGSVFLRHSRVARRH